MYWTPEKIRALRSAREETQPEFAEAIGLSERHVRNLEAGRTKPTKQTEKILHFAATENYYDFTDWEIMRIHKALHDAKFFIGVNGPIMRRLREAIRILEEKVR